MQTADKPSIRNSGSSVVYLKIELNALIGRKSGRQITDYALVFKGERIKVAAAQQVCLKADLKPGEVAGLDLVVSPAPALPADAYVGTLKIIAVAAPGLGSGRCRT